MLTIELPTRTRDYVIAIRDMPREDALTLSYLATRLGSDMLGARAARRVEPDGFTVMWSSADTPARGGQPDRLVTGGAPGDARGTAVLALGAGGRGERALTGPVYTLGARPFDTAAYIAAICRCPAAYVALGALCRCVGFVPVQVARKLLGVTVGLTAPHMLSNCEDGAVRGYQEVSVR